MKKIIAAVIVTVLLFTLCACGSSSRQITIAIPNDTTNEARALLLLEDLGYIKLMDAAPFVDDQPHAGQCPQGCGLRRDQLQLRP